MSGVSGGVCCAESKATARPAVMATATRGLRMSNRLYTTEERRTRGLTEALPAGPARFEIALREEVGRLAFRDAQRAPVRRREMPREVHDLTDVIRGVRHRPIQRFEYEKRLASNGDGPV